MGIATTSMYDTVRSMLGVTADLLVVGSECHTLRNTFAPPKLGL